MLRFSICNEVFGGLSWGDQCMIAREAGYAGLEIAPFTLGKSSVAELTSTDRKSLLQTMHDEGLSCVGLHWLLAAPPPDLHITTRDRARRSRTLDYLRRLITLCADLRGAVLVLGSPAQRSSSDIGKAEGARRLADGLAEIAGDAADHGVVVAVEPIDSRYTNVVNSISEALEIVEAVGHPAVRAMLDLNNTVDEVLPLAELIERYGERLAHIHVQDVHSAPSSSRPDDSAFEGSAGRAFDPKDTAPVGSQRYGSPLRDALEALRRVNYDGWISLEPFDDPRDARQVAFSAIKILKSLA